MPTYAVDLENSKRAITVVIECEDVLSAEIIALQLVPFEAVEAWRFISARQTKDTPL